MIRPFKSPVSRPNISIEQSLQKSAMNSCLLNDDTFTTTTFKVFQWFRDEAT
ncbi:unknown [Salmonella phage FelixO1]|uniref:Uncharacterized protein n=1 Tax=Salmonella phage Felix O1 (isolate Felix O1-VT1) TaxID=1283336 RepID=Q6KGT1_BPFO1|nr:unknown [Salmonella phage FelixO1]